MLDQVDLPAEIERAEARLTKIDRRAVQGSGWGASTGGQALTRRYHERLTEGIRLALLDAHSGPKNEAELVVLIRGLPPQVLALSCIQVVLHSIGNLETRRGTLLSLGEAIADELWAAGLTIANSGLATRLARVAKLNYGTHKRRYKETKEAVTRAKAKTGNKHTERQRETAKSLVGFKERTWTKPSLVAAGAWLYNILIATLPEVFETVPAGNCETQITISDAGWGLMDEACLQAVISNPVYWPDPQLPLPWTDMTGGGSHDERVNRHTSLVRTTLKDTTAAVRHAIKTGTMKPALDALNALQAVPFRINAPVLAVLRDCVGFGIMVDGLVPPNLVIPEPSDFADEAEQRFWGLKKSEMIKTNVGYKGDRVMLQNDIAAASEMAKHERFYTPMNMDWRGRVYSLPSMNFQRADVVRSLFLFADGLPIGEEGLRYLKIHTATCGDFKHSSGSKISKRTLQERVEWCNDNTQLITNIASEPFVHREWMNAGDPFLFLAACFELQQALEQGSSFMTHLPTSFDGSCSGLQHLSGMTRASEGSMVNLTSSPLPEDVYQKIADDTYAQVTLDLDHQPDPEARTPEDGARASKDIRAMARLFLDFDGDRRSIAKRNVMTYAYSSRKFGMSAQQQTDLMDPLARKVLEGVLKEHPFEGYCYGPTTKDGIRQPSKAARYIAGRVFDAIEARIHKPAEAMKFLQGIAKALAHEGKPVRWTTPVGLPWINRYHPPEITTVNLYLVDKGIKERVRMNLATGNLKGIDKSKAANGVAPNFVHALDASHLMLTVNAAVSEGITSIATVHDSFGCLAPHAARFNAIIREQFALMYETNDVLAQIHAQASADLTEANRNRLPDPISYGDLNLRDILDADFAFA